MASYLYAVQTTDGHEIVSAHVDVQKVGDVTGVIHDGHVQLRFENVVLESADVRPYTTPASYTLLRWPSDDKLTDPVRHKVVEV